MAWYFGPRESAQSGLKKVKLAYKMPMQSTGKEKFTVYVYFKTQLYDENDPWSDEDSEASESSDEEEIIEEEQEPITIEIKKSQIAKCCNKK